MTTHLPCSCGAVVVGATQRRVPAAFAARWRPGRRCSAFPPTSRREGGRCSSGGGVSGAESSDRGDIWLPPPSAGASSGTRAHLPGARVRFPRSGGGARVRPRPRRFRGSPGIALGVAARTGPGSSSPSRALAAQAAPAGSSPSSGVIPSRVCRVGRVAAAPPAAVAQFARLAGLGHDPREDGGHGQGVSCTGKKQTIKTNFPRRAGRCPCRPFHLFRTVTADGHTAADGCLGDGSEV